jgi:hypothetical protein
MKDMLACLLNAVSFEAKWLEGYESDWPVSKSDKSIWFERVHAGIWKVSWRILVTLVVSQPAKEIFRGE